MKQLWILLIATSCTLTVFGQQHRTDSTHPKKSTGTTSARDTGRAGKAAIKQPAKALKDSGKPASKPKATRSGGVNAGTNQLQGPQSKADQIKDSTKTKKITTGATTVVATTLKNNNTAAQSAADSTSDSAQLSPEQIAAQDKLAAAARLKAQKDSAYAAHKTAILAEMSAQSLANSQNKPNYHLYFPDYFYENGQTGTGNGALISIHAYQNRDLLFYAFLGISFLLGLIKVIFPRYFNQIFWFFLHPNDRKNNISEQIRGQNVLPSLLLNMFFVLTGGLFLAQILEPGMPGTNFWYSWAVFTLLLTGVYLVKYLVILLSGWVFGAPAAATIYNQVVFSINKIIGLLLLPATLLISYGSNTTLGHVLTTVLVIISILLIYRYIASFLLIKGKLKVSAFHFILYLCAVEIIPLLLVYKVLLNNIGRFV